MLRKVCKKVGLIAILPLALFTTSVIAATINIKENQNNSWELDKINNIFFIADKDIKVYWSVDAQVKDREDGKTYLADTVEINCDGFISTVVANTSATCELKTGREMTVRIAPEDFFHGSIGTWTWKIIEPATK